MGRNKFSQQEIIEITKLLRRKASGSRFVQKLVRHDLRVEYEFNISDFNQPGKAFGAEELKQCIERGRILILDDATIEAMKAKRARDKARDAAEAEAAAIEAGEATDWRKAQEEWEEWERSRKNV